MIKVIKRIVLIFVCGLGFCDCYSQTGPAIEWQNTIGGSLIENLYAIEQTTDGGFIIGGFSYSDISGDKTESNKDTNLVTGDYWVIKLDSSGNIQWQHTIGGSSNDNLYSIQQTFDGGYILGGYSSSDSSGDKIENNIGGGDYWVVKLDSSGNIQWQNTIGGNEHDEIRSIQQTVDGGYILGGFSYSNISGDKTENVFGGSDYWVVKLDAIGNIQWQNDIGGNDWDELHSIEQTTDGGYILGGFSQSNISGNKTENSQGQIDYWIVKLDSLGNIQWQNTIGGSNDDFLFSVEQTNDGGYILGGKSESDSSGDKIENNIGGGDYWIIKLDSSENIQWQNDIGGAFHDDLLCVQQTIDGGFILGGQSLSPLSGDKTENNVGGVDYWIVKLSSIGNIEWQKTIGGSGADALRFIRQTHDKGFIIGGFSNSNISGDKTENSNGQYDYWIVKLAPDTLTSVPNLQSSTFNLQIFPNPTTGTIQLTFNTKHNAPQHCEVINVMGELAFKSQIVNPKSQINLDVSFLAKGIYLVRVGDEGRWEHKKLVVE